MSSFLEPCLGNLVRGLFKTPVYEICSRHLCPSSDLGSLCVPLNAAPATRKRGEPSFPKKVGIKSGHKSDAIANTTENSQHWQGLNASSYSTVPTVPGVSEAVQAQSKSTVDPAIITDGSRHDPQHHSPTPRTLPSLYQRAARLLSALLLSIGCGLTTPIAAATPAVAAEYIGNGACASCHEQETADWTDSHHDLAMQEATPDTILGDFDNAQFHYHGVTTTFFRRGDAYFITTDNAQGLLETFPVKYVFGVEPLQQYLLPLPGGRLQALAIAWDTRPIQAGGQRWYHLYEEEPVLAGDPLHWTGGYFNWNTSCAECHSTDVKKRYDAEADQFNTHYEQIDVGCEACHGPGSTHQQLAQKDALSPGQIGFEMSLSARGAWQWPEGADIARRTKTLDNTIQIDTCGRCHARRSTLGDYHPGRPLLDTHRLALIDTPLYWPDGQIRDEVYVYGSFIQSKMHQAGVVCSNCHNPHSNELIAEGNAVCGQCHTAVQYDTPSHHRHLAKSAGTACVACHMPSQIYMGVDARRDHSMRIPRPDLSLSTGSPNACNQCHTEKSADWAYSALLDWGVRFTDQRNHPARAFHAADRGDVRATPILLDTANNNAYSALLRASAISRLSALVPSITAPNVSLWLSSSDPLIRLAAAEAVGQLPLEQRLAMLTPVLEDPVLGVRMITAEQLADLPASSIEGQAERVAALNKEYREIQSQHLDMPSVLAQLSRFQLAQGETKAAEAGLLSALKKNPQSSVARVNLADLYRSLGDDNAARAILEDGLALSADDGAIWFSKGLLEIRDGNPQAGLKALETAATLEETPGYYHYVFAVAQNDQGYPDKALSTLQQLHRLAPGQPNVLSALMQYSHMIGNKPAAERYRDELRATLKAAGLQ